MTELARVDNFIINNRRNQSLSITLFRHFAVSKLFYLFSHFLSFTVSSMIQLRLARYVLYYCYIIITCSIPVPIVWKSLHYLFLIISACDKGKCKKKSYQFKHNLKDDQIIR